MLTYQGSLISYGVLKNKVFIIKEYRIHPIHTLWLEE